MKDDEKKQVSYGDFLMAVHKWYEDPDKRLSHFRMLWGADIVHEDGKVIDRLKGVMGDSPGNLSLIIDRCIAPSKPAEFIMFKFSQTTAKEYGELEDEIMGKKENMHIGSSLDEFLAEAGILEEATAEAKRRVDEYQRKKGDDQADQAVGGEDERAAAMAAAGDAERQKQIEMLRAYCAEEEYKCPICGDPYFRCHHDEE